MNSTVSPHHHPATHPSIYYSLYFVYAFTSACPKLKPCLPTATSDGHWKKHSSSHPDDLPVCGPAQLFQTRIWGQTVNQSWQIYFAHLRALELPSLEPGGWGGWTGNALRETVGVPRSPGHIHHQVCIPGAHQQGQDRQWHFLKRMSMLTSTGRIHPYALFRKAGVCLDLYQCTSMSPWEHLQRQQQLLNFRDAVNMYSLSKHHWVLPSPTQHCLDARIQRHANSVLSRWN